MTIEGGEATIVLRRQLAHAPERVFASITSPDELSQWLMCSSASIEVRLGGRVELVSGPAQFHVTGVVLEWDPPRAYAHEWNVAPVQHMPRGERAIFRYELAPQHGGTLLTVTYRRPPQTARGFAPGTHVLLDRLEAQLGAGELPAWGPGFERVRALYPSWTA